MGLDMFAYTCPSDETEGKQTDFSPRHRGRIAYWRKFNALHGWMEKLYREKGGEQEDFNCTTVLLTSADIDRLEKECMDRDIFVPVAGFFFGSQQIYPEDMASLRDFIREARDEIKQGNAVYYDSWW